MKMRKSFGAEVAEIAEELNLPKATVERVLRTRLKNLVKELREGNPVTVEGLFSIKVHTDAQTGEKVLRGSVSQTLKDKLSEENAETALRMTANIK